MQSKKFSLIFRVRGFRNSIFSIGQRQGYSPVKHVPYVSLIKRFMAFKLYFFSRAMVRNAAIALDSKESHIMFHCI